MPVLNPDKVRQLALAVIQNEAECIHALAHCINHDFVAACQLMFQCRGRVIVTGMGKSGHIARKIAATFASTGTPAFFVHPGEACHGDLGMMTFGDVVLALSHSGETREILTLLPLIKHLKLPLIAMTGDLRSTLAQFSTTHIHVAVGEEACPLGLAPTSSTTAALVMGDALAISLLETRGFTHHDFAFSHPSGSLGKRLLLTVADLMHVEAQVPKVGEFDLISTALTEMTQKKLGMTAVVNHQHQVLGIFTDGDVRRMLGQPLNLEKIMISEVMTSQCTVIHPQCLAIEAMKIMEKKEINALLVVDEHHHLMGALNMHDLLHSGIVSP